jgi:hypothetical protein
MIYQTTVEDAKDGSGDSILTFPPELLAESDWEEGDTITVKREHSSIHLTNLSAAIRQTNKSVANKQQLG